MVSLTDSGAEQHLISSDLVEQFHISVIPLNHLLTVSALTGQILTTSSHRTAHIHLVVSGNHQKAGEDFLCVSFTHYLHCPRILLLEKTQLTY